MTLDDIHESVFDGDRSITNALDIVFKYLEKHPNKKEKVEPFYKKAITLQSKVSPAFSGQIAVTGRYRNYIRDNVPNRKLDNDEILVYTGRVIEVALHDSNKRILIAKEPQTKRNRQFEKREVERFFKGNVQNLQNLLILRNTLFEIKDAINDN